MEQNADTGVPVAPMAENKQKSGNGLKITTAIACVLAVCGIGFGIYGIMNVNNSGLSSNTSNESEKSEDQKLNKYETRDLIEKTLRLLGSGRSFRDYYDSNTNNFIVYKDYMPIDQLVANELDEPLKTYITLETTASGEERYCSYQWPESVKTDIDEVLGQDSYTGYFYDSARYIDCISYNKANDDYYDLWGEDMPKINSISDTTTNYDFTYGPNLDAYYYHIIGGRGGAGSGYIVGRISDVGKNQDYAYVDINAGSFAVWADNPGELRLSLDASEGEVYKTIEQDDINWDGLGLTDNDYNAFQTYRFMFKENPDGIYSFSAVEKL